MRCPRAQLRQRHRRDLRRRAAPGHVDGRPAAGPPTAPEAAGSEAAALKTATRLAAGLIRACERTTPEGSLFPVDPNLRPEGRQGPLVRTLASHLAYYDRWAKTWEFQALLKARPAAGDLALGKRYADAVAPLVWQASQRDNFVEDVQAMRRRVVDTLPKNMAGRELKLGPGGLRDIEFAVQLLQLVHGRADERLRVPATLPALAALADGGYVGRADADDLAQAYRFLRQTEHLLQLYQLRRTHTLPTDPAVLRRLGRALGAGPRPVLPNVRRGSLGRSGRPLRAGRGRQRRPTGRRARAPRSRRRRRSPRRGRGPRSGSAACTRSCSTGRCSTRWRSCRRARPGSPRRRRAPALRRSATATRRARCGTSRR